MNCYRCNAWPCTCADGITLIHGDAREVDALEADCLITDPPYQSLDVEVSTGTTTRLVRRDAFRGKLLAASDGRAWFDTLDDGEIVSVVERMHGWLPAHGASYVFSDVKSGLRLFAQLPVRNVIVWDKEVIGMGYGWRRMHEWIGYLPREKHVLNDRGAGDIIRCPGVARKLHPTEKPLGVITPLIAKSSRAGQCILDPFAGGGATLLAAKKLGRRAIGIELEERWCEVAANRLLQNVLPFAEETA